MAAAKRWAGLIAECSPMSIRASKQAVLQGVDEPSLEAALKGQNRYEAVAALYRSEDFVEGPLAFSQRRQVGRGSDSGRRNPHGPLAG